MPPEVIWRVVLRYIALSVGGSVHMPSDGLARFKPGELYDRLRENLAYWAGGKRDKDYLSLALVYLVELMDRDPYRLRMAAPPRPAELEESLREVIGRVHGGR